MDHLHLELLQGDDSGRIAAQAAEYAHVGIAGHERAGDVAAEVAGGWWLRRGGFFGTRMWYRSGGGLFLGFEESVYGLRNVDF